MAAVEETVTTTGYAAQATANPNRTGYGESATAPESY